MNKNSFQPEIEESGEKTPKSSKGFTKWLKRIGIAGFLFFLIKGILWLTVGAAVLRYFGCES